MVPLTHTLPLVLVHKELFISKLLSMLHMEAELSLEPLLRLVVELARSRSRTRNIISRLGAGANACRASIAEKLQDEEQVEKPFIRKQMKIRFPKLGRSEKSVVTLDNLQFGFGDNMLFQKANATIQRGEKIVIIGPNGCGKSTLLKLIMGLEKPLNCEVYQVWVELTTLIALKRFKICLSSLWTML